MKKVHITYGTHDFLKTIFEKYKNDQQIHLLDGADSSLLVLEKDGKSLFSSGKSFEVEKAHGSFDRATFAVLNNIPAAVENPDIVRFEAKKRADVIERQPGCLGVKVLRPIKNDSFIIISMWDSSGDFRRFERSPEYHKEATPSSNMPQELFTGKAYLKVYTVYREELDD